MKNFLWKCDYKCTDKLKVKFKDVEKILDKKIEERQDVLGLDTASKTGFCSLKMPLIGNDIDLHVGYIESKKVGEEKYDEMIPAFEWLILHSQPTYVIIEDTYFNRRFGNPKGYATMSRIGMIPYMVAARNHIPKRFLMASQARYNIGIKPSAKKHEVVQYINHYLGLKIKDHDVADAIVLALNGVLGDVKKEKKEIKIVKLFRRIQKCKKDLAKKSKNSSRTKQKKKIKATRKKRPKKKDK